MRDDDPQLADLHVVLVDEGGIALVFHLPPVAVAALYGKGIAVGSVAQALAGLAGLGADIDLVVDGVDDGRGRAGVFAAGLRAFCLLFPAADRGTDRSAR